LHLIAVGGCGTVFFGTMLVTTFVMYWTSDGGIYSSESLWTLITFAFFTLLEAYLLYCGLILRRFAYISKIKNDETSPRRRGD
jgi:hypothetical protein